MSKVLREYPSSSSNTTHQVTLGDDGVIYCTCPGWRLHKNRNCKHLSDYYARFNGHGFNQVNPTPTPTPQPVSKIDAVVDDVIAQLKRGDYYGR